jgi:tricorn protease
LPWYFRKLGIGPLDVELDPAEWRKGHDTQLDRAIQVVLELMEKNPPKEYPRPPYPNYHKN